MNNEFLKNDTKRGGLISTMVKKISTIEGWIRKHDSVNHKAILPSTGSGVFMLDISGGGTMTVNNGGATITPFGTTGFSGIVILNDTTVDGTVAMFALGGGLSEMAAGLPTVWNATKDNVSTVNVYQAPGTGYVTVQNNSASNRVLRIGAIRTRPSA